MTGEITLRGLVLPVGGIKEKVLAAKRAGIDTVILPERNKKDVEEIPAKIRRRMRFHYVRAMDDALPLVLADGKLVPGSRKKRSRKSPAAAATRKK